MRNAVSLISCCLLVALFSVGCSTDTVEDNQVSQNSVHGQYSVDYDEGERLLKYTAELRVGGSSGTTVEITAPASITVDGKRLQKENFFGTHYTLQETVNARDLEEAYRFVWRRQDRKLITNDVPMVSPVSASAPNRHSRRRDLKIAIQGDDLAANEEFVVTIASSTDRGPGAGQSIYIPKSITSGKQVTFTAKELRGVFVGHATIEVERRRRVTTVHGHGSVGGWRTSTYRGVDQNIEFLR